MWKSSKFGTLQMGTVRPSIGFTSQTQPTPEILDADACHRLATDPLPAVRIVVPAHVAMYSGTRIPDMDRTTGDWS